MATLPTSGRILIQTTVGDIEIELWAKETPLACRNLITLALEGYYDGVIFHRVVPNFLVQTGDRSGTGSGGESLYGEPFDDEIHPRLRFTHRGLVGMANNGDKNNNFSQFFITLDRADELNGKHTLFGRVVGDTIYNVAKIGELELDADERPLYPPKIRQIKILKNPFHDIVPRITAAEKRAQQQAKEQAQREREEAGRRKQAKKDAKLLSFGGEEAEEDEEPVKFKKKPMFRDDLMDSGPVSKPDLDAAPTAKARDRPTDVPQPSATSKPDQSTDSTPIPKKSKKTEKPDTRTDLDRVEEEIRRLTRQRDSDSEDDKPTKKPKKTSSIVEELNAKYRRGTAAAKRAGKRKDEGAAIAALQNFRAKLGQSIEEEEAEDKVDVATGDNGEGMEVDDDVGWLSHRLKFSEDNTEETARAEHDYEVIDPRARGAKAKEEEMARKRSRKDATGGHGYRSYQKGPKR
ncbi:Peptidyl-prolyl isomerase CWC27 Short=PPIase CWC27; AltName: Full=Rotamase CWC27 [Serendipita indica DSM 11827]|uniref:Related to Cyclophilin-16 n=1 Tax=Serendipita indica (strain DSM 11827) TaxID=1109443 RepID=G4TKN0_SERID|nr:Peptidyl-prolyl isomerase CWC27 Short=PPIase CWC27; AltName: Full=Rotamase CWC27 [Serendipita indica DSM 11827]CCA71876.1 related to Cyclophilin-16 [Serendipita indica DSM 11827]